MNSENPFKPGYKKDQPRNNVDDHSHVTELNPSCVADSDVAFLDVKILDFGGFGISLFCTVEGRLTEVSSGGQLGQGGGFYLRGGSMLMVLYGCPLREEKDMAESGD